MRDLAPITMGVVFPNVICVHSSVPAKTLADLIKMARDQPGTVAYGSSGINGAAHLAGELLKIMANAELVHVPYKGGAPALTALLANETPVGILTPVTALPHIKAGTIRALATTGAKRAQLMPDVPTVAESGYPGYEATNWYAYLAPAKTPHDIVERLHRDIVKTLNAPEVRDTLHKQGVEVDLALQAAVEVADGGVASFVAQAADGFGEHRAADVVDHQVHAFAGRFPHHGVMEIRFPRFDSDIEPQLFQSF